MLRILLVLCLCCPLLAAATLAVNLSGTTNQAFDNKLQDTDVQVARFVLQASGGDVVVDGITVHVSNPLASNAFTGLRLFYDADGNGTFDPSEELDAVQPLAAGAATFTESFTAIDGLIRELQVRVNIGSDVSVYGQAFQARIDATASIVLPPASVDTVAGPFPVAANAITLRNSVNRLVPGTGNPALPRSVERGSQNVAGVHFLVDSLPPTAPGELVGIDLQGISVSVALQNNAQTAAVAAVALWQDDGDALFEPGAGEIQILQRTSADAGKWIVAGNVITAVFDGASLAVLPQINTGQARAFWAGISFTAGADCIAEVSVNRLNIQGSLGIDADYFMTNPASIAGEVITVQQQPSPPTPQEAPGEGGCAAAPAGVGACGLVLVAPGALIFARKRRRCAYTYLWPEADIGRL